MIANIQEDKGIVGRGSGIRCRHLGASPREMVQLLPNVRDAGMLAPALMERVQARTHRYRSCVKLLKLSGKLESGLQPVKSSHCRLHRAPKVCGRHANLRQYLKSSSCRLVSSPMVSGKPIKSSQFMAGVWLVSILGGFISSIGCKQPVISSNSNVICVRTRR